MNSALFAGLYAEIASLPIFDVHTHVQWKTGVASNIGELLSYHYYTELTNSAEYEQTPLPYDDPYELMRRIYPKLNSIRNTVQYDWLMFISRRYLGILPQAWQEEDNWEPIFRRSEEVMGRPEWCNELIELANIARVFLTNQYDEDLEGLDTTFYTPCLRTEPFVLWLDRPEEREGLERFLGSPLRSVDDFDAVIEKTFDKFLRHGLGYVAISLPANFQTYPVAREDAQRLLNKLIEGAAWDAADREAWGAYAMACLCEACRRYASPFHLMIGVRRDAYEQGVPSGQDLFDSVNSMSGYDYLFNTYWDVDFPTAVLADTSGLELTAASWIRHNVYPSGHWWYANQPTDIGREIRRRLDTVPHNKLIGYFSDAYYLEFILPKFNMYRFELTAALVERMERSMLHPNMARFGVEDALSLAEKVLLDNPAEIMGFDYDDL